MFRLNLEQSTCAEAQNKMTVIKDELIFISNGSLIVQPRLRPREWNRLL
jgi:hypothetical protein